MHFSVGEGQAKLVRCARGRILDVVVDLRRSSPTYGEWESVELDDEHGRQLYIPVGFAHGFCVLSDLADVTYKCSTYYDGANERGFAYDDPEVGSCGPARWRCSSPSATCTPRRSARSRPTSRSDA